MYTCTKGTSEQKDSCHIVHTVVIRYLVVISDSDARPAFFQLITSVVPNTSVSTEKVSPRLRVSISWSSSHRRLLAYSGSIDSTSR